jgi:hypothetical protein
MGKVHVVGDRITGPWHVALALSLEDALWQRDFSRTKIIVSSFLFVGLV